MTRFTSALALCALLCLPAAATAQGPGPNQPDMPIDAKTANQVAEAIVDALNAEYVIPETAKKMEEAIRDRLNKKEYEGFVSARKFAEALTDHRRQISNDKHLVVCYSHDKLLEPPNPEKPGPAELAMMRAEGEALNFGFEKGRTSAGQCRLPGAARLLPGRVRRRDGGLGHELPGQHRRVDHRPET
jgi:N-terminal domain of Peptidase_S41 in eukaryotic IRBP